ncbi:class I SAM-dependent DNA methyltransferase [Actinomycetospora rhizophila]|uniref:Class I SAM-dependent DNA methyltransferase n=1 Tax=Actinomycetospora rhizophila TaxID=1416876 RepID=A0ABV9ZP58_9PSEU
MEDYRPIDSFGEQNAEVYDDSPRGDEDDAVALLRELAVDGPALELAIGTGRIALPLAAHGVRVDGIELSPAMVARLRSKPGGQDLAVTTGDMAEVTLEGTYRLVFVVFNSLFNLLTQDEQVRCFTNAARHLHPDGVFLVEAFVPAFLHRLRDNQLVDAEAIGVDHVQLDVARHDPVAQHLDESHVRLTGNGVQFFPVVTRYAWPAELDLMARLAGLRLHERWGGWQREPFTADSRQHISIYGR